MGSTPAPFVRDGQTVPVYSYAKAIHESVYVQAPFDSDHDGQPDRIAVDIIRPAEAAAAHVKVPVIMDASPYFQCCGRGNESETKTYRPTGRSASSPCSTTTISSRADTPSSASTSWAPRARPAAPMWADGTRCWGEGGDRLAQRPGRRLRRHGAKVTAGWSTGKVGMIGKSWDGSIANGVAATGVAGLSTVVAISSISSWYDYTRFGGVLRSPGYVDFLAGYVSGRPKGVCDGVIAQEQAASDDTHRRLQRLLGRPRLPPRRGQGPRGHVHRPRPERPERDDEPVR